jgi:hypothetical protein
MAKPTQAPGRTMDTTADRDVDRDMENKQADPGASESIPAPELHDIIGEGIAACMHDRANLRSVELKMDTWARHLPKDKDDRIAALNEARAQMETAKLAVEAMYSRFRSIQSTMKN